jgi:1-acyl-sn-glycerol-3-phosphate acyltransferase
VTARQVLVTLRIALRLAGGFVGLAWVAALLPARRRERMVVNWCRGALGDLGIALEVRGAPVPMDACLVVCNHVSWVDTVALRAVLPCGFVAKRSLRGWPVVGRLIALTGGVFVHRERPHDLPRALDEVISRIRCGTSVCLFSEATTTVGEAVAPFFPSAFEWAARDGAYVLPVALRYFEDGHPSRAAAWVGDEAFLPSLLRIARARRLSVRVIVGQPLRPHADRARAALAARAEVAALAGLGLMGSAFAYHEGGRVALPPRHAALEESVQAAVRAWIARERPGAADGLPVSTALMAMGVDSLDVLDLLAHLEHWLGLRIDGRRLELPLEPTLAEFSAAVAVAAVPAAEPRRGTAPQPAP